MMAVLCEDDITQIVRERKVVVEGYKHSEKDTCGDGNRSSGEYT